MGVDDAALSAGVAGESGMALRRERSRADRISHGEPGWYCDGAAVADPADLRIVSAAAPATC